MRFLLAVSVCVLTLWLVVEIVPSRSKPQANQNRDIVVDKAVWPHDVKHRSISLQDSVLFSPRTVNGDELITVQGGAAKQFALTRLAALASADNNDPQETISATQEHDSLSETLILGNQVSLLDEIDNAVPVQEFVLDLSLDEDGEASFSAHPISSAQMKTLLNHSAYADLED